MPGKRPKDAPLLHQEEVKIITGPACGGPEPSGIYEIGAFLE
jgi:hypothetical protein